MESLKDSSSAPKRTKAQKEADLAQIAKWRVQGLTLYRCAEELGKLGRPYTLGKSQIAKDWHKCVKLWREASETQVQSHVDRMTASMDLVEDEAWRAWEKSKTASVQKRQSRSANDLLEGGEKNTETVQTEEQYGDPRFLSIIGDVRRDRAKLLGLDAATKVEVSGKLGLTPEALAMIEEQARLL